MKCVPRTTLPPLRAPTFVWWPSNVLVFREINSMIGSLMWSALLYLDSRWRKISKFGQINVFLPIFLMIAVNCQPQNYTVSPSHSIFIWFKYFWLSWKILTPHTYVRFLIVKTLVHNPIRIGERAGSPFQGERSNKNLNNSPLASVLNKHFAFQNQTVFKRPNKVDYIAFILLHLLFSFCRSLLYPSFLSVRTDIRIRLPTRKLQMRLPERLLLPRSECRAQVLQRQHPWGGVCKETDGKKVFKET